MWLWGQKLISAIAMAQTTSVLCHNPCTWTWHYAAPHRHEIKKRIPEEQRNSKHANDERERWQLVYWSTMNQSDCRYLVSKCLHETKNTLSSRFTGTDVYGSQVSNMLSKEPTVWPRQWRRAWWTSPIWKRQCFQVTMFFQQKWKT